MPLSLGLKEGICHHALPEFGFALSPCTFLGSPLELGLADTLPDLPVAQVQGTGAAAPQTAHSDLQGEPGTQGLPGTQVGLLWPGGG